MPRILFTTAYKPYGEHGPLDYNRVVPEVFHFRLTRSQGIFSYRHHLSAFGLHAIANNIGASSTVLEYPTFERFTRELKKGYDYVGFGSMVVNFNKLRRMAHAVREISPRTKIIVGGYCAHVDHLQKLVPFDYLCAGEGISFMRDLLGDPPEFQFKNPDIYSRAHSFMGVPMLGKKTPHIIIGLGCAYGCEFCSASHHFGKKYLKFYRRGQEIFDEMQRMEKSFKTRSFGYTGDDNFLLDTDRADELREIIVRSGKQYESFYFASARNIMKWGPEKMAEMGTNMVWIGRESNLVEQTKNKGVDFRSLVADLHRHGIKVIMSTMLLMDHHTPDNIWREIDDHLDARPDYTQFSLYAPMPGTPFYDRAMEEDNINWTIPYEQWHGMGPQWVFNPHFSAEEGVRLRDKAYEVEYSRMGPSAMRLMANDLDAYLFMIESENPNLRKRALHIKDKMPKYRAILWAMARLVPTPEMRDMVGDTLSRIEKALGPTTPWEKAQAAGLIAFGLKQKARLSLFGDLVQPPTMIKRYPGA